MAVVTLTASLGALIPIFADLAGEPVAGWKRRRRIFVAALLLITGTITGVFAYQASIAQQPPIDTAGTVTFTTDANTTDTISTGTTWRSLE